MNRQHPRIGQWYQERETDDLFEIVAMDFESGTLQVQYVDGALADFELDSWGALDLLPAAEPEDWRSAFSFDEEQELDPDAAQHPLHWGDPLSDIEPDTTLGVEEY